MTTKDLDKMSLSELADYADSLSIEECTYCRFDGECSHHVTPDGNGNPCYPPCAYGDLEDLTDEEAIIEAIEEVQKDE